MSEGKLFRLIDANLNRLKEGVRVLEDIQRYLFDNKPLALRLKKLRHQIVYEDDRILKYRDIKGDVLKESLKSEQKRESLKDILKANIKRSQEASRVLEEIFKIIDIKTSEEFKMIRYELYDIEKEIYSSKNSSSLSVTSK